ncbi:hypothetical protein M422DRAFT_247596 [Sphaerobolus stellatus SS14]|nr:hypothetical protein M422DRAFT_247596 [Sphaerobolus stellatus SS14]
MVDPLTKAIFDKHPFTPGVNHGKNNFVLQPQTPALSDFCCIYKDIAINKNLGFLYDAIKVEHNCVQYFPYGRD